MYVPADFRQDDLAELHALMDRYNFATLVSQQDGQPFASHLPFLLDRGRGPLGGLRAHLARANPQWHHFGTDRQALVIFQGPHAYISPSWYQTQPSVPTWNYAVVHAYGVPRLVGEGALYGILRDLVAKHEAHSADPWPFSLPEDYLARMMQGIVGFELEIARLEGKWKLGQNRSEADRDGAIAALAESATPMAHEVAAWMARPRRPSDNA